MPFEFPTARRIAVIGGGISGLAAAYELAPTSRVTLIEAAPRLGGHARTVMAGPDKATPVDTGFIVFNTPNYPNLTRMFSELDVPVKPSNMSFAASIDGGRLEYGLRSLGTLTAQKSNLARPAYWRMVRDILRFNRGAVAAAQDPDLSLGDFLDRMQLGEWFRRYYLLPISGAIWSSTPEQMTEFPARSLVEFFRNHALLSPRTHQWQTVDGGSIEYVRRIAAAITARGGEIRTGSPVRSVRREAEGVSVRLQGGTWETFDEVVFACHSDDALAMLEEPSTDEREILGAIRYQPNQAVLHSDARQMPQRRSCWASWVFLSPDDRPAPQIGLTYWMNSLQGIPDDLPLFLSLNPASPIDEALIEDQCEFRHPVFDGPAIRAQRRLGDIQGVNRSWFCGAWAKWGFHEDGYASAMTVVKALQERVE